MRKQQAGRQSSGSHLTCATAPQQQTLPLHTRNPPTPATLALTSDLLPTCVRMQAHPQPRQPPCYQEKGKQQQGSGQQGFGLCSGYLRVRVPAVDDWVCDGVFLVGLSTHDPLVCFCLVHVQCRTTPTEPQPCTRCSSTLQAACTTGPLRWLLSAPHTRSCQPQRYKVTTGQPLSRRTTCAACPLLPAPVCGPPLRPHRDHRHLLPSGQLQLQRWRPAFCCCQCWQELYVSHAHITHVACQHTSTASTASSAAAVLCLTAAAAACC